MGFAWQWSHLIGSYSQNQASCFLRDQIKFKDFIGQNKGRPNCADDIQVNVK